MKKRKELMEELRRNQEQGLKKAEDVREKERIDKDEGRNSRNK